MLSLLGEDVEQVVETDVAALLADPALYAGVLDDPLLAVSAFDTFVSALLHFMPLNCLEDIPESEGIRASWE